MKKPLLLLFLATVSVCRCLAQSADSIHTPPVHWARPHAIDVLHQSIDLRFDWPARKAYGTTDITFRLFTAGDKVNLDAGQLTIHAITTAGGKPLFFRYDGGDSNNGLTITLDKVYQPSQDIAIRIDYNTNRVNTSDPNNIWGSFGKGLRFFEPTSTEPNKRKQLWTVGDPESNRYWLPCYDYPNDLRTTEFRATVEKPLMALSNGQLVKITENADGTRTFYWKMDMPYANHLTSFVVGDYVDNIKQYDGIPLHSYSYPDESVAATASVERLPDMVKFFSDVTGVRYPYPEYAQVFVQDFAGWMGNATLSTITENMVDDAGTHEDFLYLWDITEGEALAHQWFGNYVTAHDWSHVWLNKSFARYFSGLYNEHKNGRDEFLSYQLQPDHSTYLGDWDANFRYPVVNRTFEQPVDFTGGNYPYFHGASVLHMLRKHLGDEMWWKVIQLYLKTNGGKTVTTEDFRKAVEEASGEPMDWFFDQWLYKIGHPVFKVSTSYDVSRKELTLSVHQAQKPDSISACRQVRFFAGKVAIEIDNRIEQIWLEPTEYNTFTIPFPTAPRLVNFDYEGTWIKEIVFEKTLPELLYQFENSKDILARMDAMGRLATLAKNTKTPGKDIATIHLSFQRVIKSNAYWRLRFNAIFQYLSILTPAKPTDAVVLNKEVTALMLDVIEKDKSWVKANAIRFLGATRNPKYADVYIKALYDRSDRVANTAAIALGKCRSPKAFGALVKFRDKPSWKNQSLISAMNGLGALGDPRGVALALQALSDSKAPHWTLGTPVWDHRLAAAQTLVALGKADAGYPVILEQFKRSLVDNDLNDIFYNALQVTTLADPRGREVFTLLKTRFKDDDNAMTAIAQLETQFESALK